MFNGCGARPSPVQQYHTKFIYKSHMGFVSKTTHHLPLQQQILKFRHTETATHGCLIGCISMRFISIQMIEIYINYNKEVL